MKPQRGLKDVLGLARRKADACAGIAAALDPAIFGEQHKMLSDGLASCRGKRPTILIVRGNEFASMVSRAERLHSRRDRSFSEVTGDQGVGRSEVGVDPDGAAARITHPRRAADRLCTNIPMIGG